MSGQIDPHLLRAMTRSLEHRGPDGEGVWVSDSRTMALGHRRLAIIDLSDTAGQPMHDADARCSISFNGEIYNYRELKDNLVSLGHRFRTQSDTEVLLKHFIHFGIPGLHRVRGMFSFVIARHDTDELVCVRDRFGIKPLYYAATGTRFLCASEQRTLLLDQQVDRSVNPVATTLTVKHLWTPGSLSIFNGISRLKPGHVLVAKHGKVVDVVPYWDIAAANAELRLRTDAEAEQACRELLTGAVSRQTVADVPVGAFLSGGTDSSSVASLAQMSDRGLSATFCAVVPQDEGFVNDFPYAERVAKHLGVPLVPVEWDGRLGPILYQMMSMSDDVHADPACWLVWLISNEARRHGLKVLLSGTGGDDIFTGYRRHSVVRNADFFERIPQWLLDATSTVLKRPILGRSRNLARLRRLTETAQVPRNRQMTELFSWIGDVHNPAYFGDTLESPLEDTFLASAGCQDSIQRILNLEQLHFLSDHNLSYTDTFSMAAGVEVRVPFLDDDLVDFAATVPGAQLMSRQRTKTLLDRSVEPLLPTGLLKRPKTGFGAAIRREMRDLNEPLLQDLLSESVLQSRGLFNPSIVATLRRLNSDGKIDAAYPLLAIAAIELFLQLHAD